MNNDSSNSNKQDTKQEETLKQQQFFPGGFPSPIQPPRMEGPRSAPPNFIPQLPIGMPTIDSPEFATQYRDRDRGWRRRPREFGGCINRFTYIWLINGNSFWFYPTFAGWQTVDGFRWSRGGWRYERINVNRIIYFRCF